MPAVYANLVGGQDELVFDGGSFALDAQGNETHRLPQFVEALELVAIAGGEPRPAASKRRCRRKHRCMPRWCSVCATTSEKRFPAPSSACRAASTRR